MIVNSVFAIAFAFLCFEHFARRSIVGFAQQEKTAYMAICFFWLLLLDLNHGDTVSADELPQRRTSLWEDSPMCAQARRGVSAVQGQWGKWATKKQVI